MQRKILIATATSGYGELIKQTINDQTHCNSILVKSGQDILPIVRQGEIVLCVIDAEIVGKFTSVLVERIRNYLPAVKIVIIPPNNSSDDPMLAEIKADGYLYKPCYLPDLLKVIENLLPVELDQDVKPNQPTTPSKSLIWLQDPARAAQYLTSLSLSSSAQAALIVHGDALWAYAGQLSQPAAQELAAVVSNYWQQNTSIFAQQPSRGISDLARFIRLGADGGEYMLYATRLGNRMVLGLAFDVETPFGKIRAQAVELAKALSRPPSAMLPALESKMNSVESRTLAQELLGQELLGQNLLGQNLPPLSQKDEITASGAPLWDDVPPPLINYNPDQVDIPARKLNLYSELESDQKLSMDDESPQSFPQAEAPAMAIPFAVDPFSSQHNPETNTIWDLAYSCILVPRMPQHFLTGDIAHKLAEWLGQLCIAFGWRLEYLSILPDYMQLVVNVPPTPSPSFVMRTLRQHTSRRIFTTFNNLAEENPSGDFWAPGYLIMSVTVQNTTHQDGTHYLPGKMINDFIQQTRKNQGVSGSSPLHYSR